MATVGQVDDQMDEAAGNRQVEEDERSVYEPREEIALQGGGEDGANKPLPSLSSSSSSSFHDTQRITRKSQEHSDGDETNVVLAKNKS